MLIRQKSKIHSNKISQIIKKQFIEVPYRCVSVTAGCRPMSLFVNTKIVNYHEILARLITFDEVLGIFG